MEDADFNDPPAAPAAADAAAGAPFAADPEALIPLEGFDVDDDEPEEMDSELEIDRVEFRYTAGPQVQAHNR